MMLGAQARAAEHNAAKNASARQANREADEQKLPPKPTPISLSAYTRNPQVNRNKGQKNWVPLVLPEVTDDEEFQDVESADSTLSSQDQSATSDPNHCTLSAPKAPHPIHIRVNMPQSLAPIAPRAMRFQGHSAMATRQVAPTAYPQPVMNDAPGFIPTALYAGNPGTQTVGMYSYPQYGWMPGLPMFDHAGFMIDGSPGGIDRLGGMLVPTDITPTKQEQKLPMLSQAYRNPLCAVPDSNNSSKDHTGQGNAAAIQHQYAKISMLAPNPAADQSFQAIHLAVPSSLRRPESHQMRSDFALEPKTAICDPQPSLNTNKPLPTVPANPITPPRSVISHTSMSLTQPVLRGKENEAPYDRTSKMQKFIAAQQAVAKTGKTVLHNPDLRKTSERFSEPLKKQTEDSMTIKSEESIKFNSEKMKASTVRNVPKIPPGLGEVEPKLKFDYSFPPPPLVSQDDAMHDLFGVSTNEWLQLKPVSRKNRLEMLDMMSFIAFDPEGKNPLSTGPSTDPKRQEAITAWMQSDPRPHQAARKEVDEIAKNYSSRVSELEHGEEGCVNAQDVDIDAGWVRGAGNVMVTLTEYVAENGKKTDETAQDYFNRTKAAPEFAVERVALGTNLSSLFESERGVFYNPPNRISRDPRFRLQAKEGVKNKSEDDWPLRYDAYSRRKV